MIGIFRSYDGVRFMPRAIFQEVMKAKDKQIYICGPRPRTRKSEDNVKGKGIRSKNQKSDG